MSYPMIQVTVRSQEECDAVFAIFDAAGYRKSIHEGEDVFRPNSRGEAYAKCEQGMKGRWVSPLDIAGLFGDMKMGNENDIIVDGIEALRGIVVVGPAEDALE